MDAKPRILSTKTLTPPQKERLLSAGFALVELPFVKTRPLLFDAPSTIEKAIITSQNAVQAIRGKNLNIAECFCVGPKTEAALKASGFYTVLCRDTGEQLAEELVKRYPGEQFYYLGTSNRRDELPQILQAHQTPLTEIAVYETRLNPEEVPGEFDGILFFSPSAIQAFSEKNHPGNAVCFCIGPTTAGALEDKSNRIVTPGKPTAEHLILETIKYFKKQKTIL